MTDFPTGRAWIELDREALGQWLEGACVFAYDMERFVPAKLLQVSAPRPYALCFLLERQDGWLDHFAVMPIPVGHEARVSQLLEAEPRDYVFLLALERMEQYREVRLTRSHYFVLRQDGRLRFYKGGEAGR